MQLFCYCPPTLYSPHASWSGKTENMLLFCQLSNGFLTCFKYAKLVPPSRFLYLLFPLPGALFPGFWWLASSFIQVSAQVLFLIILCNILPQSSTFWIPTALFLSTVLIAPWNVLNVFIFSLSPLLECKFDEGRDFEFFVLRTVPWTDLFENRFLIGWKHWNGLIGI